MVCGAKIGVNDKHHRQSKYTKFHQNLRGSLQFFGDYTWNDPLVMEELVVMVGSHHGNVTNSVVSIQ